jgi:hypothetical protein
MAHKRGVDKLEGHLREKRAELMWALSLQDYTQAQIGRLFGVDRSTAKRIIESRPRDWSPKWVKVQE